jgi:diketogulonate reductase-like aldo/keto reductase
MNVPIPALPLAPQGSIPLLGFGTFPMKGDECRQAVRTALECGYRHIDAADAYGNHEAVGAGIRDSGIPREEIFLVTKVMRDRLRYDDFIEAGERSLRELKTDYLDLLLIHWPNNDVPLEETLRALSHLRLKGKINAAGVSNFTAKRLERALALDILPIGVNQVEYHPFLNQKALHQFCKENDVILTAYSPLAQGKVSEDSALQQIGSKYGKSAAQVAIRWLIQKGIVAIPKASSREHIRSNLDSIHFELTLEDFDAVDGMDRGLRLINWDVADFDRP